MRHAPIFLAVLIVVATATPALAYVHVYTSCEDGIVTCIVGILNDGYDWQGVILQWRHLNVCDESWEPVDMEPLPLGPLYVHVSHTLTFPAHDPDEWIVYHAFYIDPAGALHPAPGGGWWASDEVTCANPILSRGYLVAGGNMPPIEIRACPNTCWFGNCGIFTDELEPGTWEMYVGADIPVNVWGTFINDEMPGGSGIIPTAIEPVAPGEDCDPAVGTAAATWGALKSLYR